MADNPAQAGDELAIGELRDASADIAREIELPARRGVLFFVGN